MKDLRQAAQQALEALEERYVGALRDRAIEALEAALAEPEQIGNSRCPRCWEPITAPTPRKPMTDEEIRAVYGDDLKYRDGDYLRFARAIERAHGIGEQHE